MATTDPEQGRGPVATTGSEQGPPVVATTLDVFGADERLPEKGRDYYREMDEVGCPKPMKRFRAGIP